jgi:hypothetical protein
MFSMAELHIDEPHSAEVHSAEPHGALVHSARFTGSAAPRIICIIMKSRIFPQ